VGRIDGKRPLGRPRRRWVDNIKIDLRDIGWDGVDWIDIVTCFAERSWRDLSPSLPLAPGRVHQGKE
jgi:hypothetical protein